MFGVAWWMCAVVTVAAARVYDRCELASDLRLMGVDREHIATWVCIAFHESRFDTAARNHYSGDHGLLQISELYWCGVGKACGLPCSALRDDDITDDVQCALRIHEEHTRLQGDGFLAWVVYPQHCKHNTKKYLVDCDGQTKHVPTVKPTTTVAYSADNVTREYYSPIDKLRPPYLSIGSFIKGTELEFEQNYRKSGRTDWSHYRVDNIDALALPVFSKAVTTTTTTIAPVPTTARPVTTTTRPIPTTTRRVLTTTRTVPTTTRPVPITTRPLTFTTKRVLTTTRTASTTTRPVPITTRPLTFTTKRVLTTTRTAPTTTRPVHITTRPVPITTRRVPPATIPQITTKIQTPFMYSIPYRKALSPYHFYVTSPRSNLKESTSRLREKESTTQRTPTTKSVFDFYLNTGRPKLTSYTFRPREDNHFKLRIFSDGTTPKPFERSPKSPIGGAARNHFRRQVSEFME